MLWVVVYAGLVSLTSSSYPSPCFPYPSGLNVLGGGFFWSASRVLLCVLVRRHGAFLLWKWLSSVLLFLGLVGVPLLGVCACSLLSVVLCTRIGVLVPGFTVFLVDYSLD